MKHLLHCHAYLKLPPKYVYYLFVNFLIQKMFQSTTKTRIKLFHFSFQHV